jgi:hypothetical protein
MFFIGRWGKKRFKRAFFAESVSEGRRQARLRYLVEECGGISGG